MARKRDPATGRLLLEGVHPVISERTSAITYRARVSYAGHAGRQHPSRTFKSADDAEAWVLSLQTDIRRGTHVDASTLTVAAYFEQWYARKARSGWSGSRQRTVRMVWDRYGASYFGTLKLQRLTKATLQRFADHLSSQELSPDSVRLYMVGIKSMVSAAVDDGLLARNVAAGLDLPSSRTQPRPIWSPLQMRRFLSLTEAHPYGSLWAFLIATGCRVGEALALRWSDIDLEHGRVWIHRTLSRTADGTYEARDGTKTNSAGRTVPLDAWMVERLRSLPRKGELVFHEEGKPISRATLGYQWRETVAATGLPAIRMHDIRHSVASALIMAGVSPRLVADLLGHAGVTITLDTYSHVGERELRAGVATMTAMIGLTQDDSSIATTQGKTNAES